MNEGAPKQRRRLATLNDKHMSFILFKIGGYPHAEIAKILKVSPVTIKAWAKDPHIREVRETVEGAVGEGARKYLESLLPETVFTMAEIMRNGNSERIKLDAASRILDKALPQENVTTIKGDPNAPILLDLLQSDADKAAFNRLAELAPSERTEMAEAIAKLEALANAGDSSD